MTATDTRFADERCEVKVSGGVAIIHDRTANRYYRMREEDLPSDIRAACAPVPASVTMRLAATITGVVVGLVIVNWMILDNREPFHARSAELGIAAALLVANVIAHEYAHIVALRAFGRRIDRVGFKLNYWIFPAVYVRMSQSLLLTRPEQIIVHVAGIGVNVLVTTTLFIANALWFHSDALLFAINVVFFAVCWNAVPILNSDGYRVLLAAAGTDVALGTRRNPWWINVIRLVGVIVAALTAYRLILLLIGSFDV
jgi:putative peptide zinc metalloprotease protein